MRVLTLRQPWAWAAARGWKPIENRRWATSYRGPLAIHAGQRWDAEMAALRTVVDLARAQGVEMPPTLAADEPYTGVGQVLAVVQLTGICTAAVAQDRCQCGPWAMPGHTHWRLEAARLLPTPIPLTGRLGLWQLPDDIAAAVTTQLAATAGVGAHPSR